MGDGPGSKVAVGDGAHRGGPLHSESVTVLYLPPKPGQRPQPVREVNAGPVPVKASFDENLPQPSPAEKLNQQIADLDQNALAAAKGHDTATADKLLKTARDLADSNQVNANQFLADFNRTKEKDRQALVTALGLDPTKATTKEIEQKLKTSKLTPEQKEHLEALQRELDAIRLLKEDPAITRATAAFAKANGSMDAPSTASPDEQARVFQQNSKEAMDLLRAARGLDTSKELVGSPVFEKVNGIVTKRYEAYQEYLAGTALAATQDADRLMAESLAQSDPAKKVQAQAQIEAGYAAASKLDLAFISAHQDELGNKGNQPGRLDIHDVYALEETTVSYKAKMLIEQGKFDQALPMMAKLQGDVPGLKDNPEFQAALMQAYSGGTNEELNKHQQSFFDIWLRKETHKLSDDETKAKYSAALAEVDAGVKILNQRTTQLAKGLQTLQGEQRELNTELATLNGRNLDDTERKFETDRLNRELTSVNDQINVLTKDHQVKNDQGQMVTVHGAIQTNADGIADSAYWQGNCRYLLGDLYEANQLFHYAQDHNSSYAKNEDAFKLNELIHATNWWSRNSWLKQGLITIAGVTAGIVVGALLSETGPGGVAAGYLVANGIIDAGAAATIVTIGVDGAVTVVGGGLASMGTGSAMRSGIWGDRVTGSTMLRDFGNGAGGAAFGLTRVAFSPLVLAGAVPRIVAGMAATGSYGVVDGAATYGADRMDGVPRDTALAHYGLNVVFMTGAGAFTPMSAFAGPGEAALNRAWGSSVIPALRAAKPILIGPQAEGLVLQSGVSGIDAVTYKPIIPKADRSQERHDFSRDDDVVHDLQDTTVAPPKN